MMLAPVTHILPLAKIRRARMLPASGRVLVRTGQKVNAIDPIAQARQGGQHVVVDVRKALGAGREADRLIDRKVGEKVQKGDLIAEMGGLLRRAVRAPADGEIVAINAGQVLLEVQNNLHTVYAGFMGTVTDIIPDRGAVIETHGSLLQGVWGNGRVEAGVLLVLARSPEDEFTRDRLDVSMRGAVVLSGYCADADALKIANEMPLRGLILGGLNPDLIPVASRMNYPIVVLEGFSRVPINPLSFKLLTSSEKRDTCLSAAPWNAWQGERPEVIIPLPAEGQSPAETFEFRAGQKVRAHGAPYHQQVGELVRIRPGVTQFDNGLLARAAEVRFENNAPVLIPLSNLDVLE